MRQISSLEPTRYEITARHDDGRCFLVCYSAGSVSRRRLASVITERVASLMDKLVIPEGASIVFGTKPQPFAVCHGWTIGYSGRTQRDVRNEGGEHEFIGKKEAA